MKKLGNERFVANAKPEVVEAERKKKADAESKITSLKEGIAGIEEIEFQKKQIATMKRKSLEQLEDRLEKRIGRIVFFLKRHSNL